MAPTVREENACYVSPNSKQLVRSPCSPFNNKTIPEYYPSVACPVSHLQKRLCCQRDSAPKEQESEPMSAVDPAPRK
ncbi:hypothetical protein Tco_0701126 [Tanacetum coccineum]